MLQGLWKKIGKNLLVSAIFVPMQFLAVKNGITGLIRTEAYAYCTKRFRLYWIGIRSR
ncbi:hypothetical protein [Virgibacillus sp. Bac332]|uniref:hypothetical protein n=1 Tax=Virgibacillus sp. Bac332 TaxID=2419842 RepID=UPI0013CF10F2|nr:hypothetical protein [Virgibacillus sp. Bac332]